MRRTLQTLVLAAMLAVLPSLTDGVVRAQDNLLIKALNSNKNVVLLVDGKETPLNPTSAAGDLSLALGGDLAAALDPNKSYALYQRHCSGYVIVVEGSGDDNRCRKEAANAETGRTEACTRCQVLVGWIRGRTFTLNTGSGAPTGSTASRAGNGGGFLRSPWPYVIGGAAAGGAALALRGEDAPAAPPFAGLNFTVQLNLQGNNGCPAFTPTAVATMTFNPDPTTGAGPASVQYTGSATNYTNARAVRNGANFDITASGASVITPIRNFSAQLQATVQAAVGGGTTVVRFVETFTQLNGPGAPCNQIFSQ